MSSSPALHLRRAAPRPTEVELALDLDLELGLGLASSPPRSAGFFGRATELAQARDALRGARVVTLVGPPGAGKTRLARELGRGGAAALEVPLRGVREPEELLRALAAAEDLDLPEAPPREAVERLAGWLSRRRSRVVLDAAEGLSLEAVALLAALTRANLEWLVTSQRPLGLPGEEVVRVGPLDAAAARALVADKACHARGGEELSSAEQRGLDALTAALDRLPLALEVGAARLAVLTVDELLARLPSRVGDASVREAVRWAVGLLPAWQRQALAQLTVFAGGFDLDAAEAVLEVGARPPLDVVQALVERSLVAARRGEGRTRYELYEAIAREVEPMLDAPARRDAEARHAAHYLRLASDRGTTRATMGRERQNLEAAESRSVEPALVAELILAQEPERFGRGTLATERARLERALAAARQTGSAALTARALLGLGRLLRLRTAYDEASAALAEAEGIAQHGAQSLRGTVSVERGRLLVDLGRLEEGERALEEGVRLVTGDPAAADPVAEGDAQVSLGIIAYHREELDRAERAWQRAARLYLGAGERGGEAVATANLGALARTRGRLELARTHFVSAVEMQRAQGNLRGEAIALGNLANVERQRGELESARPLFEDALRAHRYLGNRRSEALNLCFLGQLELAAGDLGEAERALEAARALGEEVLPPRDRAQIDEALGELAARRGALTVQSAPASPVARPLVIGPGARFFVDHGEPTPLGRRRSARSVLEALAAQRERAPGEPLTLAQVVEAGWPGERIQPRAARHRVHVLINTLRKLGLDALETTDDGYRLDPSRPLRRTPEL